MENTKRGVLVKINFFKIEKHCYQLQVTGKKKQCLNKGVSLSDCSARRTKERYFIYTSIEGCEKQDFVQNIFVKHSEAWLKLTLYNTDSLYQLELKGSHPAFL